MHANEPPDATQQPRVRKPARSVLVSVRACDGPAVELWVSATQLARSLLGASRSRKSNHRFFHSATVEQANSTPASGTPCSTAPPLVRVRRSRLWVAGAFFARCGRRLAAGDFRPREVITTPESHPRGGTPETEVAIATAETTILVCWCSLRAVNGTATRRLACTRSASSMFELSRTAPYLLGGEVDCHCGRAPDTTRAL
jgi:hypothetical protein